MTPLWEDFMRLGPVPCIGVRLPSGEVEMSSPLLSALCLTPSSQPRNLDQWRELCHPADHARVQELENAVFHDARTSLSLVRRLYCGDGVYRAFRLDACVLRGEDGAPLYLMGVETLLEDARDTAPEMEPALWRRSLQEERDRLTSMLRDTGPSPVSLTSWLQGASDGDRFELEDAWGRARTFEAQAVNGEKVLVDLSALQGAEEENARLRLRLQRGALDAAEEETAFPPMALLSPAPDGEPQTDPTKPRDALSGWLASAVQALSRGGGALTPRAEQLQGLLNSLGETELIVGVVGLTSSGKSTFINAMMGERLLPEETRATTNLMILCRRGGVRAADVFYQDGRVERASGAELTPAWMEERASERRNPGNGRGIARIEWSSPSAVIPPGLALADTPGLDACDLPQHGDLVLRRLLPVLDIVLYVTSIRTRFKVADVELINAILDGDQRLIILLSQIDLERDETEAGHVLLSKGQKLARALQDLQQDLDASARAGEGTAPLRCPIIPISSKLALERFFDRGSEGWAASNFDVLIRQLSLFQKSIVQYGTVLRGGRAVRLLERALGDLDAAASPVKDAYIQGQGARVRELRDAQRWISAELSSVRNEWLQELDPDPILSRFEGEARALGSAEEFRALCLRWESSWLEAILRMTERMDRSREVCRQTLSRQNIPALDRGLARDGMDGELRQMESRFRSQGRLDALAPRFREGAAVIEEGKELIAGRIRLLKDHLNWWENRMRDAYCDPIYQELQREEKALAVLRSAPEGDVSQDTLTEIRESLEGCVRGIRQLLDAQPLPEAEAPSLPAPSGDEAVQDAGLFASLLLSMREEGLRRRFLLLPALQASRRLLLLGLRRHDGLRLLSRLMHEANISDVEAGEGEWLRSAREPAPGDEPAPPFPCVPLPRDPGGLEFLVAPSDPFCDGEADWPALFARWTPVVHLDLARVDSGLSDLARSPYYAALAGSAPRWVLAFAHGGLFDNRLSDLVLDVTERVRAFAGLRGFRGRMDWFIYENYDFRYTDFLSLGKRVKNNTSDADIAALTALWRDWELSDDPPFTQDRLTMALVRIRDRMRSDAARLLRQNKEWSGPNV